MVLPVQVTLVPNYIMLNQLGLLDTYAALILPLIFVPLGTFILRQSFLSIPDSVMDAAMLDGCGTLKILWRVAIPMNLSGMVCAFLLSFLDAWNMVEQPIAYLREANRYPISVALVYVTPSDTAIQLACCVLVALPCLFLFTFFNRELVEGHHPGGGEIDETEGSLCVQPGGVVPDFQHLFLPPGRAVDDPHRHRMCPHLLAEFYRGQAESGLPVPRRGGLAGTVPDL